MPDDGHESAEVTNGFRYEWMVHHMYHIKTHAWEGWPETRVIVPEGPVIKGYAPGGHTELPSALAQVQDGNEADVLEFVRTYGLLGFQEIRPLNRQRASPITGDPVAWIWAHAATVRFCLEVMSLLQQKNWEALAQYRHRDIVVAKRDAIHHASCFSSGDSLMQDVINQNIFGIREEIGYRIHDEVGSPGYYTHFRVFNALVEMVYWHLSEAIRRQQPVLKCVNPQCGRLFLPEHRKQKYCPPRFHQAESPCATRLRMAKWRKAHAAH